MERSQCGMVRGSSGDGVDIVILVIFSRKYRNRV